jgi:glutathione S-transferase
MRRMTLPVLTYFSSRGRAELIRLLCAEAEIAYEERNLGVYHPVEKTPAFDALKATGTLPFDAVPLWEEEDGFRLAQSNAIVRHLARTHDRYGRDAHEAAHCDMILDSVDDARLELRKLVTTEPAKRPALREELARITLPLWLARFERVLAANGDGLGFIVGDAPSVADVALFLLFENLRDNGFGAAYTSYPRLAAYGERLAARPGLASYVVSVKRFPIQLLPA